MIQSLLKAGYPALYIESSEPHRTESLLPCDGPWKFHSWDCIRGIRQTGTLKVVEEALTPVDGLLWLNNQRDCVLIAHNLHLFLDDPSVIQTISNAIPQWKALGNCLVAIGPRTILKPEIEPFFNVLNQPLPEEDELFRLQVEMGQAHNIKPNRKAARIAKGMTLEQTETSYALSLVTTGYFSSKVVSETKTQMIRKSGLMDFEPLVPIGDIGGLDPLKGYIQNRAKAFGTDSKLPRPKGLLLLGIPGVGKSICCRAAASILDFPLIRLDIGHLKDSLVGASERRIREATRVIDAFGDCVVFLDEIEKAFAGTRSSGQSDGGTTSGMFSHFLTWMAEQQSAFIMATANSIQQLPPEFLRAGRFDAVWFVDLPPMAERRDIIRIMNSRHGSQIPIEWAHALQGFSGAEIEQLAKDSLFDGLEAARDAIVPLSRTMREEIESLRTWAKTRARLANTPEDQPTVSRTIRKDVPKKLGNPLFN